MPVPVLAHLGHWYESVLYAAPTLIIGGVLWWHARRERAAAATGDDAGDADWDDDPRLRDD